MGSGKEIESRDHIKGFEEEIDVAADLGKDRFFSWFDIAKDADAAFVRGQWDFVFHIGMPLSEYISDPEDKTALEIGYGGGRILAAASNSFKEVIGIDVHNQSRLVETELKKRGFSNFRLLKSDGSSIPLNDSSVDVVYSFIVLQHVQKFEIFRKYINETCRVLKPGGIAILYFGRKTFFSVGKSSRLLYWLDRLLEKIVLFKGYMEIPAKINHTNLFVTLKCAENISIAAGLKVLGGRVSRKNIPNGYSLYGGQHGLILKKQ